MCIGLVGVLCVYRFGSYIVQAGLWLLAGMPGVIELCSIPLCVDGSLVADEY